MAAIEQTKADPGPNLLVRGTKPLQGDAGQDALYLNCQIEQFNDFVGASHNIDANQLAFSGHQLFQFSQFIISRLYPDSRCSEAESAEMRSAPSLRYQISITP